ncbi:MAG: hypothetical protein LJE88_18750 [Deltaproteobacteria bacterium]|nr:hypothetical protein [Deltaproteobacteria bacterium]
MTRRENILEEYRKGDLEKRLNLFMECPPLRSRFLEIDQRETAAESVFFEPQEEDREVEESQHHREILA